VCVCARAASDLVRVHVWVWGRPGSQQLYRRNKKGAQKLGKDIGPDGSQLIRIDGPHSAPAQHYGTYHTVMLVGAGIGLTPSAAIIRAILRYKWKKGYKPVRVSRSLFPPAFPLAPVLGSCLGCLFWFALRSLNSAWVCPCALCAAAWCRRPSTFTGWSVRAKSTPSSGLCRLVGGGFGGGPCLPGACPLPSPSNPPLQPPLPLVLAAPASVRAGS
jgi:hypothetical protein